VDFGGGSSGEKKRVFARRVQIKHGRVGLAAGVRSILSRPSIVVTAVSSSVVLILTITAKIVSASV
jgi:hypothetical protein